ncbi:MAG: Crp/Fnr family transcriptional regulator [Acidobacteria bacterium]|nr:Crp/Fnr family transcriptional regulator [Acidobacteriota bacterium]
MIQYTKGITGNRLLSSLPSRTVERLQPSLIPVMLQQHETLYRPGTPVICVYFPLRPAVISILASTTDGKSVAVAMAGSESAAGIEAILGQREFVNSAVVQFPGEALKVEVQDLRREFQSGGEFQDRVLDHFRYFLTEASQSAACNRIHQLQQRLCRWLLGMLNRVGTAELPVTHEMLSYSLGTPRSEITLAACALRKAGVIEYKRGSILILDRAKLESTVCECYRVIVRAAPWEVQTPPRVLTSRILQYRPPAQISQVS